MCGLFGFVAADRKKRVNLSILRRVATVTMERGHHAWGLAWVDWSGRVGTFKQSGRIVSRLRLLDMAADARMIIGHCRWATHGDPEVNLNNHPHDGGDSWVVHNGVIHHYRELVKKHRLRMHTDCDSEVLGLLLQRFKGAPDTRVLRTLDEAVAENPFSMMALWPDRMLAVRANGQPLHEGQTDEGHYIGSLARGLPGVVTPFPDDALVEYD